MSDLAATNCGCNDERGCGCGCRTSNENNVCGFLNNLGSGNCCSILWVIILLCFCGNGNKCRPSTGTGDCSWIMIVLLLLCCKDSENEGTHTCRC